jgi:putative toxin-antitoxin system antitoxin component (TIGR02293 family)
MLIITSKQHYSATPQQQDTFQLHLTNLLSGSNGDDAKNISLEDAITVIKVGVDGAVLDSIVNFIPVEVLTIAFNINVRTFNRMTKKALSKNHTSELYEVCLLWGKVSEFYESNNEAVCRWLCTPIRALEGLSPLELLDSTYGRRKILECVETMKFGDFA